MCDFLLFNITYVILWRTQETQTQNQNFTMQKKMNMIFVFLVTNTKFIPDDTM